jgi:hypothetical protein
MELEMKSVKEVIPGVYLAAAAATAHNMFIGFKNLVQQTWRIITSPSGSSQACRARR